MLLFNAWLRIHIATADEEAAAVEQLEDLLCILVDITSPNSIAEFLPRGAAGGSSSGQGSSSD